MEKLFSSESVSAGHPDKICDQISDAILDACLAQDEFSRVACEVMVSDNNIILAGEITTKAVVDYVAIAKDIIKEVGYDDEATSISYKNLKIQNLIIKQSPDIAQSVDQLGAGDQGLMFGYATNETNYYGPLPITLAHELVRRATKLMKSGEFKWAKPDMKSQVTIDYTDPENFKVNTVLMSIQHAADYDKEAFNKYVKENIIKPVIIDYAKDELGYIFKEEYKAIVNPSGQFVIGGPKGDAGLTGRKIIVDTYGGSAPHGGGAFSGKDATKVDRSGAYYARYAAKNIVAAGLCDRILIQVAYAIGQIEPINIFFDTYGTEKVTEAKIKKVIDEVFDFRPHKIIEQLDLRKPVFKNTATYGHFSRDDHSFAWEKEDKVQEIQKLIK